MQRGHRGVDGHVASAYDDHAVAKVGALPASHRGEDVRRNVHTVEVLARQSDGVGPAEPDTDDDRVEPAPEELGGVLFVAAQVDHDAQPVDVVEFALDETAIEPERRDALREHASHRVGAFEHFDDEPALAQLGGSGEPGRTRAQDGDLLFPPLGRRRQRRQRPQFDVARESLEARDVNGRVQVAARAVLHTEDLLRADAPAYPHHQIRLANEPGGAPEIAEPDLPYEPANVHSGGTSVHARSLVAHEAP